MTPVLHMTDVQEKRIYRNSVQACLHLFYGKSKAEAAKLVREWWSRLSETKAYKSGIFLHAEPMNTAADLAEISVIPITADNRLDYHRILDESRDLILANKAPSSAQVKNSQTKQHKQYLPIASSGGRASVPDKAQPTMPKKAKLSKTVQEQRVAYN